jgi:O-acetyl-ADP-ribose deacetylase (regulator of RNase III)
LETADELRCRSIAIPSISTGIFGFPVDQAAVTALATVEAALAACKSVELARFCLFTPTDLAAYRAAAESLSLTAEPDLWPT